MLAGKMSRGIPDLDKLPPGCKYLDCNEARDVLKNLPTWRLPNGSVLAPFGGELYQVVELPMGCGEHCKSAQPKTETPVPSVISENIRLINNQWLRFRQSHREEYSRYSTSRDECMQMPVYYTDGRVCNCQYCVSTMFPDALYSRAHSLSMKPLDSPMCRLKQERFSPSLTAAEESNRAHALFPFSLPLTSSPTLMTSHALAASHEEDRRPKTKRFQCVHCDKSFGKSSHLRDHIRTHTGDRPFRCQYCNKAFTQYSNLRTHTRIHTGEKPFKCQHCSKSFTQAVTLRSHTRTHTGAKPYNCKRCSKSFSCFSGLRGHNRIHADVESSKLELDLSN
ncbi:zinc finger protein 77 [Nematostella vectensis]|nr:zinc finger protein 77 [Nematostella vectensis]